MLAVTIGIGPGWGEVAARAALQMKAMTGLAVRVIDAVPERARNLASPSWLKCFVCELFPEEEDFLVFDADIVCLRPWQPECIFTDLGKPFCAVPDAVNEPVFDECVKFGIPFPDCYVNGGLTMFTRAHQPIWDYVWGRHPTYGTWLEQTALNEALIRSGIPVARLPRRFNTLIPSPVPLDQVVNLHLAGEGGNAAAVLRLQDRLWEMVNGEIRNYELGITNCGRPSGSEIHNS